MVKAEANCIQNIERGFAITRELKDIQATYDKLVSEGRLQTAKSDERGGITGKSSLTPGSKLKPHQCISIMYCKIAALRWTKYTAIHYNSQDTFPDEIPIRGLGKKEKVLNRKKLWKWQTIIYWQMLNMGPLKRLRAHFFGQQPLFQKWKKGFQI